ncbi:arylesterase [Methylophaga lonarensis]|uniref:arylesterase n=1 Tax=Methylophaga lonarensis TaxID=999151 RepID=UPI003D2808DC
MKVFIFLLSVSFWLTTPLKASETEPVLLVVGDSLSAAYGIDTDKSWVALLRERLSDDNTPDWQVVNASISGETTEGGLARLPGLLAQHQPDLVIIELGGNDGLRGHPLPSIRANLEQMIQMTLTDARILLVGIELPPNYGPRYTRAFADIYRELAEAYQVDLLPFFLAGVYDADAMMQADGLHPTEAAQPQLLENIWPYLKPLLTSANLSARL